MTIENKLPPEQPAPCNACPILEYSLCLPLPARQRESLRSIARSRIVPQGQLIFEQGNEVVSFASIMTGVVKLLRTPPAGGSQIVAFMHPPEFIGYTFDKVHLYSAEAATDVEICIYPRDPFLALLGKSKKLSRSLFEAAAEELDSARKWRLTLGRVPAYQRVVGLLAKFAQHTRSDEGGALEFLLPASRSDLADYLGLTVETVSRNITILRQKGLIELKSAREVFVPNMDDLLAEADMIN